MVPFQKGCVCKNCKKVLLISVKFAVYKFYQCKSKFGSWREILDVSI